MEAACELPSLPKACSWRAEWGPGLGEGREGGTEGGGGRRGGAGSGGLPLPGAGSQALLTWA